MRRSPSRTRSPSNDPWQVSGWLTQLARVREGRDRFAAARSAHEALIVLRSAGDFKVVQFPHRSGQVWAALPEAWRETEGTPLDPKMTPEELHEYLAAQPGTPFKNIQRAAPNLAIALHAPDGSTRSPTMAHARVSCATNGPSSFPIRSRLLPSAFTSTLPALARRRAFCSRCRRALNQDAGRFDDAMDVIHEAFDLAKLRGVRPRDLAGGLGAAAARQLSAAQLHR